MKLKTGKEEIVYLLTEVFKKYEKTTGQEVIRNTNRKNYEDLARLLSTISNELPHTSETLDHDHYPPERDHKHLEYPYLKYDITGGQLKDAYNGIVTNPRPFIVDACYIYLYGVGRRGFEKAPKDANLLQSVESASPIVIPVKNTDNKKERKVLVALLAIAVILLSFSIYEWQAADTRLRTLKTDLKLTPYVPTQKDIESLEGVWQVYIGSPQARVSDNNRYHMVVSNIVDVKYKNGYFLFNRYGASFDHEGYMQFESADVVSIHSYVKNNSDTIESPRLSLMRFDREHKRLIVISASWNFDVGSKNDIIGIREVYTKQGKNGLIEEVINTIENSSCRCKIVRWQHDGQSTNFQLRNMHIDSLGDNSLKSLLDEHSILLRQPESGIILTSGDKSVK